MLILLLTVTVPICLGVSTLFLKNRAKEIALITALLGFTAGGVLFFRGGYFSPMLDLKASTLSAGIFLTVSFLTLLIISFSLKFMEGKERLPEYYGYILIALGASAGTLFANNYLSLLVFWGILGIALYMLVGIGGGDAAEASEKTFNIVGGADAVMIFGIGIIWLLTGSLGIGAVRLNLNNIFSIMAFISLLIGVLAKAGAIPFHSWVADAAESAPATVLAFFPGALDKLIGIYLLIRIAMDVFLVEPNSAVSTFLLAVGAITILVGVLAALVQHNLKKLLAFHAVSQVGYIILGIGTGIPVAVAGGIFHMLNNAIYKVLLFLSAGAVESQTGTVELKHLGGLAKFMPVTFACALVAALSISGVPPLNGFVSKWMIYQGLVQLNCFGPWWVVWLTAAMFGSALTLASFVKVVHAAFLGQWSEKTTNVKEVSLSMQLPMLALAALCILFGIFAFRIPLQGFILPVVGEVEYLGFFQPVLAAALVLLGLLIGVLIYWMGKVKGAVSKPVYIGGELLEDNMVKVSGERFYNEVEGWGFLHWIYEKAEERFFDWYGWTGKIISACAGGLRWLQAGYLGVYLAWIFAGGIILILLLAR